MTTITIERALLEQALNALTSFEQNYGSLWYSSYEPDQIDSVCSALRAELAKPPTAPAWHDAPSGKLKPGDRVRKIKGSQWRGQIVGWYSTALTPVGWAVESDTEVGSVQIYPESALELVEGDAAPTRNGYKL